jgi:hypothetical protein
LRRYRPEQHARASEDVNLEDVIDEADLDPYDRILRPASYVHRERRDPVASSWTWSATSAPASSSPPQPGRHALPAADPAPARRGGRAETASSDQRLELWPSSWCWDVCGYYRILGAGWKASRLELRHAYQRLEGHRSALRTYAMSQLMDEALRREYDALPLGTLWLKDRYVQEFVKKRAAEEARARSAAPGRWRDRFAGFGILVTPEDILGEWGFGLDREQSGDDDDRLDAGLPPRRPALGGAAWMAQWSYYASGWPDASRVAMLPLWQDLLLGELRGHEIRMSFAVGVTEKSNAEGFAVSRSFSTGSLIIFLAGDHPTRRLAAKAVVRAVESLRRQNHSQANAFTQH